VPARSALEAAAARDDGPVALAASEKRKRGAKRKLGAGAGAGAGGAGRWWRLRAGRLVVVRAGVAKSPTAAGEAGAAERGRSAAVLRGGRVIQTYPRPSGSLHGGQSVMKRPGSPDRGCGSLQPHISGLKRPGPSTRRAGPRPDGPRISRSGMRVASAPHIGAQATPTFHAPGRALPRRPGVCLDEPSTRPAGGRANPAGSANLACRRR
jgi:hypothetical protein